MGYLLAKAETEEDATKELLGDANMMAGIKKGLQEIKDGKVSQNHHNKKLVVKSAGPFFGINYILINYFFSLQVNMFLKSGGNTIIVNNINLISNICIG